MSLRWVLVPVPMRVPVPPLGRVPVLYHTCAVRRLCLSGDGAASITGWVHDMEQLLRKVCPYVNKEGGNRVAIAARQDRPASGPSPSTSPSTTMTCSSRPDFTPLDFVDSGVQHCIILRAPITNGFVLLTTISPYFLILM